MHVVVAGIGERKIEGVRLDETNARIEVLEERCVLEAGRGKVRLMRIPSLEVVRMVVQAVVRDADIQNVIVACGRQ
jgi:hypothetical protein